jgi:hypothetical protein
VDVSDTRGQGGFWDWKLSKYIIGGLGALTVIGLIMLTCMVVVSKGPFTLFPEHLSGMTSDVLHVLMR